MFPGLSTWQSDLEILTREHREARARELAQEARRRRSEAREHHEGAKAAVRLLAARDGPFPELRRPLPGFDTAGTWHFQRAKGQRERFDRLASCQKDTTVEIKCEACGSTATRGARCRAALVCVSCRGKIGHEKRARLAVNRRAAVDLVAKRGLLRTKRRGGRWSEKLVTLTLPHCPALDVVARVKFARAAWGHFSRHFGRWLRLHADAGSHLDRVGYSLARWYRNFEWTTGEDVPGTTVTDVFGHPHFHLWFLGPFLPGASEKGNPKGNVVRNMWRDAIRLAARGFPEVGIGPRRFSRARMASSVEGCMGERPELEPWDWRDIDGLPHLVVDVRALRPGKESLREVVKYLFKDTIARGGLLPPKVWAKVFEACDGSRSSQGSRGLMTLALREHALDRFVVDERGKLRDVVPSDVRKARLETADGVLVRLGACPCGKCGALGRWKRRWRPMTNEERSALSVRRPLRKARTSIGVDPMRAKFAHVVIG